MTRKVAPFGAGATGGALGIRLADTGNVLTVFNLDAGRVQALVALLGDGADGVTQAKVSHVEPTLRTPGFKASP